MQAHVAGLANLALPLGLRHASRGQTGPAWEEARAALARRLRVLLPLSVPRSRPLPPPPSPPAAATPAAATARYAVLMPGAERRAEAAVRGGGGALVDAARDAGFVVVRAEGGGGGGAADGGGGSGGESHSEQVHAWRVMEQLLDPAGAIDDGATLLLLSGESTMLTYPAD